jgi:hypothetical protein
LQQVTDPPYNVKIGGHVCGSGAIQHREFAMASGEMDVAGFTAFLESALSEKANVSVDCAIHFVCMDWRHMPELQAAGDKVYSGRQRDSNPRDGLKFTAAFFTTRNEIRVGPNRTM